MSADSYRALADGVLLAHLAAIGVVVIQAWFGITCPLTTLEMHLRDQAGDATYNGTFVAHWLRRLVFFDAPLWGFAVGYTLFGRKSHIMQIQRLLAVACALILSIMRSRKHHEQN